MSSLIDREQVQRMMRAGAQLVEVLPAKEFAEDHLPGAVSHPLGRLETEAKQIDPSRDVIVYCWDAA